MKILIIKIDETFETVMKNKEKNIMEMIFNARRNRNKHLNLMKEAEIIALQ